MNTTEMIKTLEGVITRLNAHNEDNIDARNPAMRNSVCLVAKVLEALKSEVACELENDAKFEELLRASEQIGKQIRANVLKSLELQRETEEMVAKNIRLTCTPQAEGASYKGPTFQQMHEARYQGPP